jgi:hypothetical protein
MPSKKPVIWEADVTTYCDGAFVYEKGYEICDIPNIQSGRPFEKPRTISRKRQITIARLIAAAPQLLAAAKLARAKIKQEGVKNNFSFDTFEAWVDLDCAIKKAEGVIETPIDISS